MEKSLMRTLEQGKLGNVILGDFTSLPYAAVRSLVNAISRLLPVKKYLSSSEAKE